MDSKEVERLLAVLESRRVAASVVGAVVIVGTTVAITQDRLLAAAKAVPALGSSGVVMVVLLAALACGYSLMLLLLGVLEHGGRAMLGAARRRRQADAEHRAAHAKREAARQSKAERLRLALPHLSERAHDTLRQLLEAGADGLALKRGDSTLMNLSELGFVEQQAPLDKERSVFTIPGLARSVVEPFLLARREQQIRTALREITPEAARLLDLFALPEPDSGEPRHPWMERAVYDAARDLERAKVLMLERGTRASRSDAGTALGARRCDEHLTLAADAIPFVETLVLQRPVLRRSLALDWSQIAGSGASGSGARPMSAGIRYPAQYSGSS